MSSREKRRITVDKTYETTKYTIHFISEPKPGMLLGPISVSDMNRVMPPSLNLLSYNAYEGA